MYNKSQGLIIEFLELNILNNELNKVFRCFISLVTSCEGCLYVTCIYLVSSFALVKKEGGHNITLS